MIHTLEKLLPTYLESFEPASKSESSLRTALKKINYDMTPQISLILNLAAFDSVRFCHKFLESQGIGILYKYLNNELLLSKYVEFYEHKRSSKELENIDKTMRRVIGALVCLGRVYSAHRNEWKEQSSVKNILAYLDRTKNITDNKLYSCMAIAFVADDDDIDKLPQLKEILPDLVKMVAMAAKLIKEDLNLKRGVVQLDENNNISKEVREVCLQMSTNLYSNKDL